MYDFITILYYPSVVFIFVSISFLSLFIKNEKTFFKLNFLQNLFFALLILVVGSILNFWEYPSIYAVGFEPHVVDFVFREPVRLIYIGIYFLVNAFVTCYKITNINK